MSYEFFSVDYDAIICMNQKLIIITEKMSVYPDRHNTWKNAVEKNHQFFKTLL